MLVPVLARPFHGLPNSGDYLIRPGFNLCVHLCHGKYLNVLGKLLFYNLHVDLCYTTSDDQSSDLSVECQPKCKKRPPKSSKNEMFAFGLHSTSDDQPSDPNNESRPKCKKKGP